VNIQNVFKDGDLSEFMRKSQQNNWVNTYFENYNGLSTKNKGEFGEMFVEKLFRSADSKVEKPTNPGHDRIIDNYKTEIKFSLANSPLWKKTGQRLIVPDEFTFNHIACDKDWERFVFCGVNPSKSHDSNRIRIKKNHREYPDLRLYFMEKKDFLKFMRLENNKLFNRQQGGEKGGNDDYMLAGMNKVYRLFDLPFVKKVQGNW